MSETATIPKLAYAFAKERGVIVLDGDVRPVVIGVRGEADPWALIEARRAVGAPITIDQLPPEAFERRLSEIYSVEGISTDCLLYTSDAADE